jgi:hypothetical protein
MSGAGAESTSFVQGMCTASHPFEMSVHNKLSPMQCKIPPCLFHQCSQPNTPFRIHTLNFEKKYFTGSWIIYLTIMVPSIFQLRHLSFATLVCHFQSSRETYPDTLGSVGSICINPPTSLRQYRMSQSPSVLESLILTFPN